MTLRLAFAGFRHSHIKEVHAFARGRGDVQIVAACEEDAATRRELAEDAHIRLTHANYDELFGWGRFDALAVGECYGRRGAVLIRALEAGKHVIVDKPVCTSLEELKRIADLSAGANLCVGCQLSSRDSGNFRAMRQVIASGRIGQVVTVNFTGQHPLLRASRPAWYFQPGLHGGTINDIAIHAFDLVPWMTGRSWAAVIAARVWNGGLTEPAFFQIGGQMMLRLDNQGGVLGDVSYLSPDACGYAVPSYWRYLIHGSEGQAETGTNLPGVSVWRGDRKEPEAIPPAAPRKGGYFEAFLAEVAGRPGPDDLHTADVLAASRVALLAQRAAEENLRDLPLG